MKKQETTEVKPLEPVKATEKLQKITHLTIVKYPDRGERWYGIVATETQGDETLRRKVLTTIEGQDNAFGEFVRLATRIYYSYNSAFDDGEI